MVSIEHRKLFDYFWIALLTSAMIYELTYPRDALASIVNSEQRSIREISREELDRFAAAEQYPMREISREELDHFAAVERLQHENDELRAKVARLDSELIARQFTLNSYEKKLESQISAVDACQTKALSDLQSLNARLVLSEQQRMPDYEEFSRVIDASKYRTSIIAQGEQRIWAIKTKSMPEYFVEYGTVIDERTARARLLWKSSHNVTYVEYDPNECVPL